MLQAREICYLALTRIGAINFGENPDSSTSDVVLQNLQMMMDEWSIRVSNYRLLSEITTSKNIITMGVDSSDPLNLVYGDISARPAQITDVVCKVGQINYPLSVKPYAEYHRLPVTNINAIPTTAYIDYGFPFVSIYLFPGISIASQLRIMGRDYFSDDGLSLNDYVEAPREWKSALVTNLALKIAGTFGIPVSPDLTIQASSDLKHIKQRQLIESMRTSKRDYNGGLQGFNIIAGR